MDILIPSPILLCVSAGILSFFLSIVSIPRIIYIAKRKRLFDIPDNRRKVHTHIIPRLGGVAIFFAFMISTALFIHPATFMQWNYYSAAALILFIIGVKDDLVGLPPLKKLMAQVVAAWIIVYLADIRLTSLYGFLGIYELPYVLSIFFSVTGCVFITNAFNLIDGIDGLAGSIGVLSSLLFGILLFLTGNFSGAVISFSLMGAVAGFLRYNISPARIFMGDTGAMLIGFPIAVMAILFIRSFDAAGDAPVSALINSSQGALLLTLSILFIPVFDTLRVFTTRLIKGLSPFRADRTHLHHYLLDLGFSHKRTVLLLLSANILIISVSLLMQDYNLNLGVAVLFFVAFGLFTIMYLLRRRLYAFQHEEGTATAQAKVAVDAQPDKNEQPAPALNGGITVKGKRITLEDVRIES